MDAVADFEAHLARAHDYRESAQWEFMARELHAAKFLCESRGFPDAARRRREVLGHLGSVERRLGRYEVAQRLLEEVIRDDQTGDTQRLEVSGELSVVYRHLNDFAKAGEICNEQYQVARRLALKAEEEMCRAIGNLGMANYQLSQERQDKELLHEAITQVNERVKRAQDLQVKLQREDPTSKTIRKARTWESIGFDRLTLCYAADGNTAEAVDYGKMSLQVTNDSPDPTIRAMSRFFCGYALLRHGERDEAMELFTSPHDQCTCAIALCKEPTDEYCQYLNVLVGEGINLEHYDEQGYSALDYAVFGGHQDMQEVILVGLKKSLSLEPGDITRLLDSARLKNHYKELFQEYLRPELSRRGGDSIQKVRVTYAKLLSRDPIKKGLFDNFKFVRYSDFVGHGRLPSSTDNLAQTFEEASMAHLDGTFDPYVVFFSYRWIGIVTESTKPCPDDAQHTQYKRMRVAIEDFLKDSKIDPEQIYIWLDWACIDQEHKDLGVNALPVIIAQCNAMVSLIDDTYFHRAWCALEASMIQTLVNSHGQHYWYTHTLQFPETDRIFGILEKCTTRVDTNPTNLPVSIGSDRPRIAFLYKQSILLGNATV